MKEIFTAIKTRFDSSAGDDLRTLLGGSKLYVGRAPQETPGNYITLSNPAGVTEYTFLSSGIRLDEQTIDVHCWTDARTPLTLWDIVEEWKAVYDDVLLTISGFTTLKAERITPGIQIEEPDEKGWQIVLSYNYKIQA